MILSRLNYYLHLKDFEYMKNMQNGDKSKLIQWARKTRNNFI